MSVISEADSPLPSSSCAEVVGKITGMTQLSAWAFFYACVDM